MTYRRTLGRWGENLASRYLKERGYQIIDRNVHTSYGEIDIIALQSVKNASLSDNIIVFVEVKARSSLLFGPPEVSITIKKQSHLIAAAQAYLQEHPEWDNDWRIDVIAIQKSAVSKKAQIVHFENAIS